MTKCWRFYGQGVYSNAYFEYFACGKSATYQFNGVGYSLYIDGVNLGGNGYQYRAGTQNIEQVNAATPTSGFVTSGSCSGCEIIIEHYDCINGACINKNTYNTPGLYKSLSECETVCGTGCSGKCISNSDWSTIEGLASQLKNKNCS